VLKENAAEVRNILICIDEKIGGFSPVTRLKPLALVISAL
jgi:hypothetical protein